MGWNPFKSETKISVATSVMRVLENKHLPNSLKSGLVQGLFGEGDQLVENILEEMTASIGNKAEQMYQYAKKHYTIGLPSSTYLSNAPDTAIIQAVIEDIENRPVILEYAKYGALNHLHYGWLHLCSAYNYNPVTNILGTLSSDKGSKVYLTDLQVVVVDATVIEQQNNSLAQWGYAATSGYSPLRTFQSTATRILNAHTPYAVEATASEDHFRLSYAWVEGGVTKTGHTTFPMSTQDPEEGYFQVKYTVDGVVKYWTYQDGLGTYPTLDSIYAPGFHAAGSFFPFVYFRYNNTSLGDSPTSYKYRTSEKLLKYFGMDYAAVLESINENPDIDSVESAFMMMAVPAKTNESIECRYLFDFFKKLLLRNAPTGRVSAYWDTAAQKSLIIQDTKFKMAINMKGVYRRFVVGSIGVVGTYTSGYGSRSRTEKVVVYADASDTTGVTTTQEISHTCHYYSQQISSNMYEEIQVDGLNTQYFVWGGYNVTGYAGEKILLIPLEHAITETYGTNDKERLYSRSMHYVFNSKVETKVKWYQQEWFQIFIAVVAIVITVFSWGASGTSVAGLISAATASASAFFAMVIIPILKFMVLKVVFKLFVKTLGPEFAMALAIVAACYGLYDPSVQAGIAGSPWATSLLQLSTGLIEGVQESLVDSMALLQDEANAFNVYADTANETLKSAQELLEHTTVLNPLILFGETPNNYYNRTVHMGNIGMLGIDSISTFVDYSLRLPDMNQTLQDVA